jgi:hypothetical protein
VGQSGSPKYPSGVAVYWDNSGKIHAIGTSVGEGVETGWRASLADEGTVRLSSKGESDRITQRSAVQIRPPQP